MFHYTPSIYYHCFIIVVFIRYYYFTLFYYYCFYLLLLFYSKSFYLQLIFCFYWLSFLFYYHIRINDSLSIVFVDITGGYSILYQSCCEYDTLRHDLQVIFVVSTSSITFLPRCYLSFNPGKALPLDWFYFFVVFFDHLLLTQYSCGIDPYSLYFYKRICKIRYIFMNSFQNVGKKKHKTFGSKFF